MRAMSKKRLTYDFGDLRVVLANPPRHRRCDMVTWQSFAEAQADMVRGNGRGCGDWIVEWTDTGIPDWRWEPWA